MTTTKPKLCIDCRHFVPNKDHTNPEQKAQFAFCAKSGDKNDTLTLVDGRAPKMQYCSIQRTHYDTIETCGPDAKYFEAKTIETK